MTTPSVALVTACTHCGGFKHSTPHGEGECQCHTATGSETAVLVRSLPAETASLVREAAAIADTLADAVARLQRLRFQVESLEPTRDVDPELVTISLDYALDEAKEAHRDVRKVLRRLGEG